MMPAIWKHLKQAGPAALAAIALLLTCGVPGAPEPPRADGAPPAALVEADVLRREVRRARILNVPAQLVTREAAYAAHLERAAIRVSSATGRADTSAVTWGLVVHLLGAHHPAATDWLEAAASGHRPIPRTAPDCAFWIGVHELRRGRVQSAVNWLARPVPGHLRDLAEWLRVRTLDEVDDAQAGALALELIRGRPDHRFHTELALRAARHLVAASDPRAALTLLAELTRDATLDAKQGARARLWTARACADLGDRAGFQAALSEAIGAGPVGGEDPQLALDLAREALRDSGDDGVLRDRCVRLLIEGAPLDEALGLWSRRAAQLDAAVRVQALDELLSRLRSARRESAISDLVRALDADPDASLARRAWLEQARVYRRRDQTAAMERAYRTAAAWEQGETGQASADPSVGAALWEWGRELEDARRFREAANVYARRAAWERAAGAVPEAAQRAGYCAWRAGDLEAALRYLEAACAEAPPRLVAAPCFWRGVLGAQGPDSSYLRAAAGEERPGYAARRAMLALRPAGEGGGLAFPGDIWNEVAAGVRDPFDWNWPPSAPALPAPEAEQLLAALEGQRALTDAALLLAALGHPRWGREMGAKVLPAPADSASLRTTAALARALGDYPGAYTDGSGGGHEEYPVAFAYAVATAARRFKLSPAFLEAVMRQESGLDPSIRSAAGAIGLMQLMPATARRVAASLGMTKYSLERPEDNVMLGAAYLAQLLAESDGNVPVCLASYNAGRGNAVRWLERVRDVPEALRWDAYLEAIGFQETRTFVRRVLRHYWGIRAAFPPVPAGEPPGALRD